MSRRTSLEQLVLLALILASMTCVVGALYVVIGTIVTNIKYRQGEHVIGNKNVKHGLTRAQRVTMTGELARARRTTARTTRGSALAPNFHTHIGRVVTDGAGNPTYERVPSIHGKGRYRIKYEYVPRFSDPGETARVMVMAAARKAKLDARSERMAPRIAAMEARQAGNRAVADARRKARDTQRVTRRLVAATVRRRGWTLPRALRERVTAE